MKGHEADQSTGWFGENQSIEVKRFRESKSEAVRRPGHEIPGIDTKFREALVRITKCRGAFGQCPVYSFCCGVCSDGDPEFLLRPLVGQSLQQIDAKQRGCDCVPSGQDSGRKLPLIVRGSHHSISDLQRGLVLLKHCGSHNAEGQIADVLVFFCVYEPLLSGLTPPNHCRWMTCVTKLEAVLIAVIAQNGGSRHSLA
jgi:hypothetical protein